MSEKPQSDNEKQLENFFAVLAGTDHNNKKNQKTNDNSSLKEEPKKTDHHNDSSLSSLDNQSKQQTKITPKNTASKDTNKDVEFEVLQQLFGKSEVDKLKDRVSDLEKQSQELTKEKDELKRQQQQLIKDVEEKNKLLQEQNKVFEQILKNNLTQLKQDLLIDFNLILDKFVRENIDNDQKFSIKVVGLHNKQE